MHALTIVALLAQLKGSGYSQADRAAVLRAYELAVHLFSARVQPSGAPFLVHLVRTASILAADRLPAPVLAAALLHVAYGRGDFGDGRGRGAWEPRRGVLRRELGEAAEDHVRRYAGLRWTPETIPVLAARLAGLEPPARQAVAMKLASELEHHLDGEILYYGGAEPRRLREHGATMAAMAGELDLPRLAAELMRVYAQGPGELPAEVRALAERPRPYAVVRTDAESAVVPPASHGQRWRVGAAEMMWALRRRKAPAWLRRLWRREGDRPAP